MGLKSKKILRILLVMALTVSMFGMTAFATTDSVNVYVHDISANTDTFLASYSRTQLENFSSFAKYNYSSKDCKGKYVVSTAKGPELGEVLEDAISSSAISLDDVGDIKIVASDNYTKTLTKTALLDTTRYYYNSSGTQICEVPTILATKFASGADVADGSLSTTDSIRNYYGQANVLDYVVVNYIKNITTITIYIP